MDEMSIEQRISKKDFLAEVSQASGVPVRVVSQVYDAIIDRLVENVRTGKHVTLTGFGKFYAQRHRGHTVQFAGKDGSGKKIGDYSVLKFSAVRTVNKSLGHLESFDEE